jgi:hypothetical protein
MIINSSATTKRAASVVLAAVALLVTGCGIDAIAPETATDTAVAIAGVAHGGQQPIVGATVTLCHKGHRLRRNGATVGHTGHNRRRWYLQFQ